MMISIDSYFVEAISSGEKNIVITKFACRNILSVSLFNSHEQNEIDDYFVCGTLWAYPCIDPRMTLMQEQRGTPESDAFRLNYGGIYYCNPGRATPLNVIKKLIQGKQIIICECVSVSFNSEHPLSMI